VPVSLLLVLSYLARLLQSQLINFEDFQKGGFLKTIAARGEGTGPWVI